MTHIAPSLLAADFLNLGSQIELINRSEAYYLHLDVMDGVFVPNISFGFPVIEAVGKVSSKPLDVHLMVVEPQKWIAQVRDTGAEMMNFHWEACRHVHRTVDQIKVAGMKAGITLCPATPVEILRDIIADLDMVLLMTVNPGFGGQRFITSSLDKVRRLRDLIASTGSSALIEVDGGVNMTTGRQLADAGADILVAGSYVFKAADPIKAIADLHSL